jgi:hypothetical protein
MEEDPLTKTTLLSRLQTMSWGVAGIILALSLSLLIYPSMVEQLSVKKSEFLATQARLLKSLSGIPSPTEMTPGIQNSQARFVVEETARQAENIAQDAPDMLIALRYRFLSYMTPRSPLSGVASNHEAIEDIAHDTASQIDTYDGLLTSLLQFIEYSPVVDTTDYQAESNETQQRMERLTDGLESTSNQLGQLPSSPVKDSALAYISSAKQAQADLMESGNTEAFTSTIERLQQELIQDLATRHQEVQETLRSQLIAAARLAQ